MGLMESHESLKEITAFSRFTQMRIKTPPLVPIGNREALILGKGYDMTERKAMMISFRNVEDGREAKPEHPEYAKAWAEGEWADCKPQSITLKVWLERWVDGMEQDELCVAVFPTPDQEGIVLEPADVADAIAEKQAKRG